MQKLMSNCVDVICEPELRHTLPHVRQYVPDLLNLTARMGPSCPCRRAVSCVGRGSGSFSSGTSGGGAGPYFSRIDLCYIVWASICAVAEVLMLINTS